MSEREHESLGQQATRVTSESRMVLPGVQAILGFQLVGVLNERFTKLTSAEQELHVVALVCLALAMGLVMAPAAYHRIAEFGIVSQRFITLASITLTAAMVPLAIGICLDIYLVTNLILGNSSTSAVIAAAIGIFLFCLWFAFPVLMRLKRSAGD